MELDDDDKSTIKLQNCLQTFINHVDDLRNEDDPSGDGFTREFRDIREQGIRDKETNKYPAEEGRKPVNIKKNRYKDILPFDKTRVPLDEIPGEDGSDYINANFIEDQYGARCYIASQGPVHNTVYDFWRMVIQYKVKVIAMACRLIEMGKKKCEKYWPDNLNETVQFKDISVTLISQEDLAEHCTKRVLRASQDGSSSLMVTQFHYTGWPDHDIPNDFDVILEMMAEMREIKSRDTEKSPMVIHCSAGCGRTGTMIAIDYVWDLLKTGKMDDSFNMNEIVQFMRTQRQSMVQAPEQYMMAHVTVQKLFQKHLFLIEDHIYGNIGFDTNEDGDGKPDGSASEAGSETSSGLYESVRKKSVMEQDIVKTIQKVTHATTADELLTPTEHTADIPVGLQEPLTPTPAVYVVPSDASPNISALKSKFSEDNSKETKKFTVESIENIPSPSSSDVKMRYLDNLNKSESSEKKLSYVSNETGKHDLVSKKAMFEKPKFGEKPLLQPQKSLDKVKPVATEMNNNQSEKNAQNFKSYQNVEKPPLQRIESHKMGDKNVTVISIGGAAKTPLNKAVSVPAQTVGSIQRNDGKSKTLPNKGHPFTDTPQSSLPPDTPPTQRDNTYSVAGGSQFYSSLSDYSSAVPKTEAKASNPVSDDHYSALANYSSANVADKNEYSYAKPEIPKEPVGSKPGESTSNVYSYVYEQQGAPVYAAVTKSMKSTNATNGAVSDATYETVTIGKTHDEVPSLPNRGYLDDGNGRLDSEKSGAGDSNTLGKKAQLTSAIKNLFTGKGGISTNNDHIVPSDIPGFKNKLGKKPVGPREPPVTWKKSNTYKGK